MKLGLRQEDSVAILEISGQVDDHNFQVLKAGITKLLQNGKNRIVLNLADATELKGDVIRELAIIDVFARELSGKIILASGNPELKESVRVFAKPPVIPILSSVELALDYFRKSGPAEEDGEENAELRARLEQQDKQIASLENRLKLQDPAEVKNLRAVNAELKTKVALLEEQVEQLVKEGRQPVEAEGFLEKIEALEDTVKRLAGAEKR
jgi:anti-anti-sigma regulatory factor